MQVILGGVTLPQLPTLYVAGPTSGTQGLVVNDAINQRSTCDFYVVDTLGTHTFAQGTALQVLADTGALAFSGFVADSVELKPSMSVPVLVHHVTGADNHYLADKRVVATAYTNTFTCGGVAADLVAQYLAAEGVYYVKNLLDAATSQCSSITSSISAAGSPAATLSVDSTTRYIGGSSIKAVTTGDEQGIILKCLVSAFQPTRTYTFSAYVKATAGKALRLYIKRDDTFGVLAQVDVTASGGWDRLALSFTTAAAGSMPPGTNHYWLQIVTHLTSDTFWTDAVQFEPNPSATAWEVGGTSTVQNGPTLSGTITYNYKPASTVLDQLAQLAGFIWWIDAYRRLYFVAPATYTAPWTFDGTQPGTFDAGSAGSAGTQVEHYNRGYRNSQYVLGVKEVTSPQTEHHQGDGHATSFTLGYPVHQVPSSVTVDGVSKTLGIKGVDTGKDWYWSKGDTTLEQDSGGTVLTTSNTLAITYVGEYAVVAYAQDAGEVTTEQAREGVGTGIVEEATTDTKLTTSAQAFQEAAGLLGEYSQAGTILTFSTTQSGLAAGQLLSVNLPWGAKTLTGAFLVEAVRLRYEPNNEVGAWWYDVRATEGPVSETWVQWFTRIVQPPSSLVDVSSLGQQDQLVALHSAAVPVTLGGTVTRQTITYSFPSSSSYPSTSRYPGSAGTATALTWYKPNVGLNYLAAALGNGQSIQPTYFAWGTGIQGTPATATGLASEQGRKLITSSSAGAGTGEELLTGVLSPADANGLTLTEFGLFGGAASATAGSGTLLLYATDSVAKTASLGVNVVADLTIS